MARKKERGGATNSGQREARIATVSGDQFSESTSSERRLIRIYFLFFIILPAVSVLIYHFKFSSNTPRSNSPPHIHHSKLQQHQDPRVTADVDYQQILTENERILKEESHRQYSYPVLAYITPWNSKGYDMAKQFVNKFTHLSPVWYDLKSKGADLVLEGRHNVNQGWMSELREKRDALVVPRIVLEAFPKELLSTKRSREQAIQLVVSECKTMDFDGVVLESWSRWAAYGVLHEPEMRKKALQFVKQLGRALQSVSSPRSSTQHLELIYVIGPPHSEKLQVHDFGPEDLRTLSEDVDGFALMTYDFSGPSNPGPNAPLPWIHFTLQLLLSKQKDLSQKIFLGINFYGNDFILSEGSGGGAIIGRDYLSLLEKHKPQLQWEKNSGEHFFLYVDDSNVNHAVFYPSLMSISLRLEEAQLWRTGISIWEIGQGLDYFFDIM